MAIIQSHPKKIGFGFHTQNPYPMNHFQILLFFYKIEWILDKIKEFVKNSFKNEKIYSKKKKIVKNSFNFNQKWTNIVFIKSSS